MEHQNLSGKERFDYYINDRFSHISKVEYLLMLVDCVLEKKINGVRIEDYFKYEFFLRNWNGRRRFSVGRKRVKLIRTCNQTEECRIFDDKKLFSQIFKDYIGREVIDLNEIDLGSFKAFAKRNPVIFAKPSFGKQGVGTKKIVCTEDRIDGIYNDLAGNDYVVEGYIEQCEEFRAFNSSSVNTIRVLTFVHNDGTVSLLPYAALRLGRAGQVADNFHYEGIACLVDTAFGCVIVPGIDQHGNRYVCHPDSGKQIVGFNIPCWGKICDCVSNAALVCPNIRLVGWDVTVNTTGEVLLVEGNTRQDPDVIQAGDGIGKWYIFEQLKTEL